MAPSYIILWHICIRLLSNVATLPIKVSSPDVSKDWQIWCDFGESMLLALQCEFNIKFPGQAKLISLSELAADKR